MDDTNESRPVVVPVSNSYETYIEPFCFSGMLSRIWRIAMSWFEHLVRQNIRNVFEHAKHGLRRGEGKDSPSTKCLEHFIRYIHVAHPLGELAKAILVCSNKLWCTISGARKGWHMDIFEYPKYCYYSCRERFE